MGQKPASRIDEDMERDRYHIPVLVEQVVELLVPIREGIVVDATFGGGGHTRRLKAALGGNVRLVGVDRDPEARANGAAIGVEVLAGNFADLDHVLDEAGIGTIHGLLFDLGISSRHVDDPDRGFSYRADGPLDMRMDTSSGGPTAADLVNTASVDELTRIISQYGEERLARRIARAIVDGRPFDRTLPLADTVSRAVPAARRRVGHPARKTFQALRIAVNGELDAITDGLESGLDRLAVGGRCVVISYHSLEDRIVKRRFAAGAEGCICPPDLPTCVCGVEPSLSLLTRKAIEPEEAEVAANPRARSARLRAVEKVAA
jgi:16S rRNA (cytosine1402-N4)-methyltransferase